QTCALPIWFPMYHRVSRINAVDRPRKAKVLQVLIGDNRPARSIRSPHEGDTPRMEKFLEPIGCDGLGLIHQHSFVAGQNFVRFRAFIMSFWEGGSRRRWEWVIAEV